MTSNTDLRFSREANQDLDDILQYTAKTWGNAQEIVYGRILHNAFARILRFPEVGRPAPHAENERELILRHHTIVYRYRDETVTILRIVNPRQRGRKPAST